MPQRGLPYAAHIGPFMSLLGAPCTAPPYGVLTTVDLVTHKVVWSKPLGTARDSGPLGLASHLPITMGVPNAGGSITTRGGLVFIAATQERTLRARCDHRHGAVERAPSCGRPGDTDDLSLAQERPPIHRGGRRRKQAIALEATRSSPMRCRRPDPRDPSFPRGQTPASPPFGTHEEQGEILRTRSHDFH